MIYQTVSKTKTATGLKAFVHIIDKVYEKKRKVCDEFKENLPLIFDEFLPRWNYRAIPRLATENAQVI